MATLVSDDFTDVDGTLLTSHTPNIDVVGGGWLSKRGDDHEIQSNAASRAATAVVNSTAIDSGEANVIVEVDIVVGSGGTNAVPGLLLRTNGVDEDLDGYFVRVSREGNNFAIVRLDDGAATELASTTVTISPGASITITVTMDDGSLMAALSGDASAFLAVEDSTYNSNTHHALYGVDNGTTTDSTWDNFRVSTSDIIFGAILYFQIAP